MRLLSLPCLIMLLAATIAAPARAVPPTATPSPGYDARLAEQRRAAQMPPPMIIDRIDRRKPAVRHRQRR
jgi:hypothetical protein